MKRFDKKSVFVLFALIMMVGQANAQFTTTFAKNATPGQQNGLYYSLPQTMLKLDFIIEETSLEPSPLSDYASNFMSTGDYVEYKTTEYRLLDVQMSTVASPDPNAMFFVSFGSSRGGGKVQFDMLPNGILRSVGMGNAVTEVNVEKIETVEENKTEPVVSTSKGLMNLMTAGKSNSQLAKEVADKIEEIRKAKFYLISGDVEMAHDPATFNAMYQKLDEMENEYTSLLLGKRVAKTVVKSVYVIPNKEIPLQTVAKFSTRDGLSTGTVGSGEMISVQTLSLNSTASINAPSQSAVESMSYQNQVFYRVPEMANVKVTCGDRTLVEDRVTVNQLGALLTAPLTNASLVFDTKTGQIVNMMMQ